MVLGEAFPNTSQRKWLKSQAQFFRLNFENQFSFRRSASGKGNTPDVLEISANLLLSKMRRLATPLFLNYVVVGPCR